MNSTQRKILRGLAHHLEPVVYVGKNGLTPEFLISVDKALLAHELIKAKFIDGKEEKKSLSQEIAEKSNATLAGLVGNIAIFYKPHPDLKKRKIKID